MEREYEINCEIKKCLICQKYIEHSNQRILVEHNHYHRCCLDNMWLQIGTQDRYKMIHLFLKKKRENMEMRKWFGYDV